MTGAVLSILAVGLWANGLMTLGRESLAVGFWLCFAAVLAEGLATSGRE